MSGPQVGAVVTVLTVLSDKRDGPRKRRRESVFRTKTGKRDESDDRLRKGTLLSWFMEETQVLLSTTTG